MERQKQKAEARPIYVSLPVWVIQTLEDHGRRFNISVNDLVRSAIYGHHKDLIAQSPYDPSKGGQP